MSLSSPTLIITFLTTLGIGSVLQTRGAEWNKHVVHNPLENCATASHTGHDGTKQQYGVLAKRGNNGYSVILCGKYARSEWLFC